MPTRRDFLAAGAAASQQLGAQVHEHDHEHQAVPSDLTLRVKALESLLVEKGLVDPAALDALVDHYEHKTGPRNGAKVVARAWVDPAYKQRLLADATSAIAEFGFTGAQGEHMMALENTPKVHNLVVCTLCSCYPWSVLGLPPVWYKSAPYRSRSVIDPRGVLREFGLDLPEDVEVRVWDSTAELRYLVLPERPSGAESEGPGMNGVHDMGGMQDMGRIQYEKNEPVFHARWEARAFALNIATRAAGNWNIDAGRYEIELLPAADYLRMSYYEKWTARLERLLVKFALVTPAELETGKPASGSAKATPRFTADRVAHMVRSGALASRNVAVPQRFQAGQHVRARNINPTGHTRLPRYARGKTGSIHRHHGVYVFPDSNARFAGENPQHLYSVRFSARELWGDQASPRDSVYLDMWDDYLEPA